MLYTISLDRAKDLIIDSVYARNESIPGGPIPPVDDIRNAGPGNRPIMAIVAQADAQRLGLPPCPAPSRRSIPAPNSNTGLWQLAETFNN
jgi:hypothetical protein